MNKLWCWESSELQCLPLSFLPSIRIARVQSLSTMASSGLSSLCARESSTTQFQWWETGFYSHGRDKAERTDCYRSRSVWKSWILRLPDGPVLPFSSSWDVYSPSSSLRRAAALWLQSSGKCPPRHRGGVLWLPFDPRVCYTHTDPLSAVFLASAPYPWSWKHGSPCGSCSERSLEKVLPFPSLPQC